MSKRLFLIDGNSLINRAFYALPPLNNAFGEPTNAVYGFTMMLLRLMEEFAPDNIYVAFDVSKPTFRHERYDKYKATRQKMPDDLRPQIPIMKDVLDAFGIPRLELAGYEADDVIGTVAKHAEKEGFEVFIVTGDRDALQLVSENIRVLLTKKGIKETELIDPPALQEKYQLTPKQIIDLKGLMGDSSDNIPGVPGVGEKTALKLLGEFPSLEEIYANIDNQKGKLRERLEEFQNQAFLSRELATIDCNVPISVKLDEKSVRDEDRIIKLFSRLEFNSLLERMNLVNKTTGETSSDGDGRKSAILNIVDEKSLISFCNELEACKDIAIFFEIEGELETLNVPFFHISLDNNKNEVWSLQKDSPRKGWDCFFNALEARKEVYCHDAKQLYLVVAKSKRQVDVSFDTALAGYVLDPTAKHDLSTLSIRYLNQENMPDSEKAARIRELKAVLRKEIQDNDLAKLYFEIELPLAKVLACMESRGILVDPNKLKKMSEAMEQSLARLTEEIYNQAGEKFNINSPKQLGDILFNKLNLPVMKKTKTGPSTNAEVLEKLSDHPIVASILEYRQISKLKSTYADALSTLISPKTKRIHTTFNQMVTATGRLSSTNPNLQNIPIRTEEGRKIREAFVAESGHVLLAADYSQIELRILAHICGDEKLVEAFRKGVDIHTQTASEVLGIPLDEVTSSQRSAAKAINFGIIYGISSFGLARGTNLNQTQAQQYIDEYFARYPKVKEYMDSIVKFAEDHGYVTTLFNRRRYLPDIKSRNYAARSFAARTAMNTPIQGSAADIIKLAMIKVERALSENKFRSRLLLQVHDELVLEVPEQDLPEVASLVKREMENAVELKVPLIADAKVGTNWKDVAPYHFE